MKWYLKEHTYLITNVRGLHGDTVGECFQGQIDIKMFPSNLCSITQLTQLFTDLQSPFTLRGQVDHPSIHPSAYPGLDCGGSRLRKVVQMILAPAMHSSSSGGSQGVPRPDEICNPSSVFWVYPKVSYQLDVPGKSLQEGT